MTHTVLVIFRIEKRRKTYNKNLNLITTHLSQIVILKNVHTDKNLARRHQSMIRDQGKSAFFSQNVSFSNMPKGLLLHR